MSRFVRAVTRTIILFAGVQCLPALALDGVSGKVHAVHVAEGGNLPFRVYLQGSPILCTGGMAEGFLDDADPNYKVFVSTLLMAKAMDLTVTLHSELGSFGRCKIRYIVAL